MDKKFWFFFILIILIAPLIIICAVVGAKDESRGKFDERQLAAQGTCYKTAYFTMMGYYVLYFCVGIVKPELMDFMGIVGAISGVIISGGVFSVLCIIKDAYIPPKASAKANLIVEGVLMAVYIFNILVRLGDGFVKDGRLNLTVVMLELVFFFGGIFAAQAIKYSSDKKQGDA